MRNGRLYGLVAVLWVISAGAAQAGTLGSALSVQANERWQSCMDRGLPRDCVYTHPATVAASGVLTRIVVRSASTSAATPVLLRHDGGNRVFASLIDDRGQLLSEAFLTRADNAFALRTRVVPGDQLGVRTRDAPTFLGPLGGGAPDIVGVVDGVLGVAGQADGEVLIQADVEPDADGDGYGDATQDQCPDRREWTVPCPHLAMRTTVDRRSALPGGVFVFTTTIRNIGPARSKPGGVHLALEPAAPASSLTAVGVSCPPSLPARCDVPGLDPGQSVTVTSRVSGLLTSGAVLRTELLLPEDAWARPTEAYNSTYVSIPTSAQLQVGLAVRRARVPRFSLSCAAAGDEACSGQAVLERVGSAEPRVLSRRVRFTIPPGRSAALTVPLTRSAAALTRRRTVKAVLVVRRDGASTGPIISRLKVRVGRSGAR